MIYRKRTNRYTNSTGTLVYDCDSKIAYSYDWYTLCFEVNGKMYLNDYPYSNTTGKHRQDIIRLLNELGIKIENSWSAPRGLHNFTPAIEHYKYEINQLDLAIKKPKSHWTTNFKRMRRIDRYQEKIKLIEQVEKEYNLQRLKAYESEHDK